jgi:beta-lactamase class A
VHAYLMAREGLLSLDEARTLHDADKTPGSGVLSDLTDGAAFTLRDLCTLMIVLSDNTAANLVLDRVGVEAVTQRMRSLGLRRTTLYRRVFRLDENRDPECLKYGTGSTTAREMVRLLALLHRGRVGDGATSAAILRVLARQQHTEGIPRFLPSACRYAGKGGAIDRARNDVGLLTIGSDHTIAIAVFCRDLPALPYTVDHPALLTIGRIARAIVLDFAPEALA